jgi:transcription antitermination factor NusG
LKVSGWDRKSGSLSSGDLTLPGQAPSEIEPRTDFPQKPWFAIRVSSNHERISSRILLHKGYEVLVPLYSVRRRWSDRFKVVEAPLFSGYFFCRMDPELRLPVLVTPGVVQIVGFGKTPAPVADTEIASLQTIVNSNLRAQPWPYIDIGQSVRVEYGPLRGVEGILLKLKNRNRLVASVSLLQRSVAVELEDDWVRPMPAVSPTRQPS